MKFSPTEVAFGRHETFHLRFAWLSKGFAQLKENSDLFKKPDEATVTLGVGKNMVMSIRYWLRAAGLVEENKDQPTELGAYIFDKDKGVDPFLEDEGTLWLIHWLIASNASGATTIAWFFNKYHKGHFDQSELRAALSNFLQDSVQSNRRAAPATQKNDISVLIRLYAKTQNSVIADEALDSPLAELGLITGHGKTDYQSVFDDQPGLPSEILGYALISLFNFRERQQLPVEELVHSKENYVSLGTVFRLTESAFMAKLDELVRVYPQYFTLRDTAGLRQLYLSEQLNPQLMLDAYYGLGANLGEAA
tara:strand:+ start:623 stop:1543 length:921 start_codon:yes stop_codon:yes gene_type:complete